MGDKELIAEARQCHQARGWSKDPLVNKLENLANRLADALEAATDGDYHEGLEEGIKIGRAERDAALATIERVRGVIATWKSVQASNRDQFESGNPGMIVPIDCVGGLSAALDGAPEPEWEYARQNRYGNVCEPDDSREQAEYRASLGGGYDTVVRRPLVWWEPLPVEGESK